MIISKNAILTQLVWYGSSKFYYAQLQKTDLNEKMRT